MSEALHRLLTTVEALEEDDTCEKIIPTADLSVSVEINGCEYHRVSLIKHLKSYSRPLLILLEGDGIATEYLLKREDVRREWAAMGCLNIINWCWEHAGFSGFAAQVYDIIPIGDTAGLVSVVKESTTLDRLKREADAEGRGREYRVMDFLKGEARAQQCLANSTAAYLASNYFLGVGDGHGDNVMLTRHGHLFRVDFGYVFGETPTLPVIEVSFDAPVVWLPEAVVVALLEADHWERVLEDSVSLVRKLVDAPGEFWCRILAACHCIDGLWQLGSAEYVISRSVQDFQLAVEGVRGHIMKQLKTMFHYTAGYTLRPVMSVPADSVILEHGLLNLLYQTFDFESSVCVELVAEMVHHSSELIQIKAILVLAEMGEQGLNQQLKIAVWVLGAGCWVLAWVPSARFRVLGARCWVLCQVPGAKFRVAVAGCRVLGVGCWVPTRMIMVAMTVMMFQGAAHADRVVQLINGDVEVSVPVKRAVVQALAQMSENGAIQAAEVVRLLRDDDSTIRKAAVHALGNLQGGAAYVSEIAEMLSDMEGSVRATAVIALARTGEMGIVQVGAIAQILADPDPAVRVAALHSLAETKEGGSTHVEAVSRLLMDRHAAVRGAAAYALAKIGSGKMGAGHARAVAKLLTDESTTVRGAAALTLSIMSEDGANYSKAVVHLLKDTDDMVRCAAAIALMRMDKTAAMYVKDIAGLLIDDSSVVRSTGLLVLAQMSNLSLEHVHAELETNAEAIANYTTSGKKEDNCMLLWRAAAITLERSQQGAELNPSTRGKVYAYLLGNTQAETEAIDPSSNSDAQSNTIKYSPRDNAGIWQESLVPAQHSTLTDRGTVEEWSRQALL